MANFALRLDDDLKQKLTEIAKKEKRSLNKTIEHILDLHVNHKVMVVANEPLDFNKKILKGIKKYDFNS